MTMSFITIKAAYQAILAAGAVVGRYRVLGYDDDKINADYLEGSNRLVQVYNQSGEFPKGSSGYVGSVTHDPTINIDLTTSATAKVDVSALEDPNSTATDFQTALAAAENANALADADLDEFVQTVYQILMSAENIYAGLGKGYVANRWVPRWSKGKPMQKGGHVIITATLDMTYRTNEELTGVTPTPAAPGLAVRGQIETTTDEDSATKGGADVVAGGSS